MNHNATFRIGKEEQFQGSLYESCNGLCQIICKRHRLSGRQRCVGTAIHLPSLLPSVLCSSHGKQSWLATLLVAQITFYTFNYSPINTFGGMSSWDCLGPDAEHCTLYPAKSVRVTTAAICRCRKAALREPYPVTSLLIGREVVWCKDDVTGPLSRSKWHDVMHRWRHKFLSESEGSAPANHERPAGSYYLPSSAASANTKTGPKGQF